MTRILSIYTIARTRDDRSSAHGADWRKRAACLDEPPELFFPTSAVTSRAWSDAAKAVCHSCPVEMTCLEEALTNREPHGVWGGLDPMERTSLLRREYRARAKLERPISHGTEGGYRTHHRRGDDPCLACSTAANAAHERRKAQRAQKATTT